jgi:hypothetical protein
VAAIDDSATFDVRVVDAAGLSPADLEQVLALFHQNYRSANDAYLLKSLPKLRNVAIASANGVPAGFAVGDLRVLDLPRLPAQTVAMAGMCCISPEFRRRGLFGLLERRAMGADLTAPPKRLLSCGRMAHPVSFRTMARSAGVVPRRGTPPTQWQKDVGIAIAREYGVPDFDPETFVCHGTGEPIGYPVIDMELAPEEWEVFRPVNRDRGDSLLGLAWMPDAPDGW